MTSYRMSDQYQVLDLCRNIFKLHDAQFPEAFVMASKETQQRRVEQVTCEVSLLLVSDSSLLRAIGLSTFWSIEAESLYESYLRKANEVATSLDAGGHDLGSLTLPGL